MLLLPTASVNAPPATSMVVAPCPLGVNVAVYTVLLTPVNAPIDPPLTVMSPAIKFVVASLDVKVNARVPSLDVNPSAPSAAVIVIVGAVPS